MSYTFKIALRYFFSRSKQTVVNRINSFALFMVSISTAALFIVLSAFAGLKDFGLSFVNKFDPDFEILPNEGAYVYVTEKTIENLIKIPEIIAVAPEIEEKVFLTFKEKNQVATLKAVSPSYTKVIPIDSLITLGDWLSFKGPDVVLGFGVAGNLTAGVYDYNNFLNVTVPKKSNKSLLNLDPFNSSPALISGLYQVTEELDKKYLFSSLEFGQELLELDKNQYSFLALKTGPEINKSELYKRILPLFKFPISLSSRKDKNAALYRMLNVENLAIYFIFSLVMVIALFNLIGALIMMVLDKQKQLKILLCLGARPKGIQKIFFLLGMLICSIGGTFGLMIGIIIVLIQLYYPLISVPGTNLSYPVLFEFKNIFVVIITLITLGTFSTFWATNGISKKIVRIKQTPQL